MGRTFWFGMTMTGLALVSVLGCGETPGSMGSGGSAGSAVGGLGGSAGSSSSQGGAGGSQAGGSGGSSGSQAGGSGGSSDSKTDGGGSDSKTDGGVSSDSKTDGSFSSSVAGSTPLNTLTPAQHSTLCKEFGAYLDGPRTICPLVGLLAAQASASISATDAQLRKACTDAVASCQQQLDSPDGGASSGSMCEPIPANCTATVAEMSACLTDQTAVLKQTVAQIPACASLTRASFSADGGVSGGGEPPEPPSCMSLSAKCPSLNVTGEMNP